MKTLSIILSTSLFLLSSCIDPQVSRTHPGPVVEPATGQTIEELWEEENAKVALENEGTSFAQLLGTDLAVTSYNAGNDTVSLNRILTDTQVAIGNAISSTLAAKYDNETGFTHATTLYNRFHSNDRLYVDNCSVNSTPHVITGIDGVTRIIEFGTEYIINNMGGGTYKTGFSSFRKACRYLTSDIVGKLYSQFIIDTKLRAKFPVKYKKTGGVGGLGRIQSLDGSMVDDFCARNFAATDNLDTLGLCL